MAAVFVKDPEDVLDYVVPWSEDPEWVTGDTISASEFTVVGEPAYSGDPWITVESDSFSDTDTVVWVSSGVAGYTHFIDNHVTTAGGRELDKRLVFVMTEFAR